MSQLDTLDEVRPLTLRRMSRVLKTLTVEKFRHLVQPEIISGLMGLSLRKLAIPDVVDGVDGGYVI